MLIHAVMEATVQRKVYSFTNFWESSEEDSVTECSVDDSCYEGDSPSDYSGSPPAEIELFENVSTHRLLRS